MGALCAKPAVAARADPLAGVDPNTRRAINRVSAALAGSAPCPLDDLLTAIDRYTRGLEHDHIRGAETAETAETAAETAETAEIAECAAETAERAERAAAIEAETAAAELSAIEAALTPEARKAAILTALHATKARAQG